MLNSDAEPLDDMARFTEAAARLAEAFGQLTSDQVIENLIHLKTVGNTLDLERGQRLLAKAGVPAPLTGEDRAAYWRRILTP